MAIIVHTVEVKDGGDGLANQDRLTVLPMTVANGAGGAGATVTVAVAFSDPVPLPYKVFFDAGQGVLCFATEKNVMGFTLNINPRLAADSVAAGSVSMMVVA